MTLPGVWATPHRDNDCGMPILQAGFERVEDKSLADGD